MNNASHSSSHHCNLLILYQLLIIFIDINELSLPKTCQVEFPDPDELLHFKLIISPDEVSALYNQMLENMFFNYIDFLMKIPRCLNGN